MRRRSIQPVLRGALALGLGLGLGLLGLHGCGRPADSGPGATGHQSGPPPSASTSASSAVPSSASPTSPDRQPPAATPTSSTLVAFVQVRSAESGAAAEVTTEAQFDRFLGGQIPGDREVRATVQGRRVPGIRLFAFVLEGCQYTGASLVIQPARVFAVPTGGAGVQCLVAEYYLAVFAVPAGLVPAGARVG